MGVPSTVLATGTPQGASAFHGSGAGFTGELRPREVEQLTQANQSEQSMAWHIKLGQEHSHMTKAGPIRVLCEK